MDKNNIIDLADEQFKRRILQEHAMTENISVRISDIEPRGDRLLTKVLKEIGREKAFEVIVESWPNLDRACTKFCSLISNAYPGEEGTPLINVVIADALDVYGMMSRGRRDSDVYCMIRFLHILADASSEIQKYTPNLIDIDGNVQYWPYYQMSIHEWCTKAKATEIFFSPSPDQSIDTLRGGWVVLSAQIMSMHDIGKMATFADPSKLGFALK